MKLSKINQELTCKLSCIGLYEAFAKATIDIVGEITQENRVDALSEAQSNCNMFLDGKCPYAIEI